MVFKRRPVHQSCDAEVTPRPLLFSTVTTSDTPGGGKAGGGVAVKNDENVGRPAAGKPSTTSQGSSSPPNNGYGNIAVFSAMNQECISPGPGSSISVVGPLPASIAEEPRNSMEAPGVLCWPGSYFFMIACGLSAAALAAYNGIFMGSPVGGGGQLAQSRLPHANANSYYYFLLPMATMVPVVGSLFGNQFGQFGAKHGSSGSRHGSVSDPPISGIKTASTKKSSSSSTHPTSCTTCLSNRETIRQNLPFIVCGLVVGSAVLGGLGFLIYRLRNPPPPPIYQRPAVILGVLGVAAVAAIVIMASRQPPQKK